MAKSHSRPQEALFFNLLILLLLLIANCCVKTVKSDSQSADPRNLTSLYFSMSFRVFERQFV
jgi:hypothetical protein